MYHFKAEYLLRQQEVFYEYPKISLYVYDYIRVDESMDVLFYILGRRIEGKLCHDTIDIFRITGFHAKLMYTKIIETKRG